ncbi:MAG: metallophosphoesterase family protein [Rhodothermales bacterium]
MLILIRRLVKLAVISDIHSNHEALAVALRDIERRGVDEIYCLGDIVGYGPNPATCVDLVRANCAGVVLGNHDLAIAQWQDVEVLPRSGQAAAKHNRENLSDDHLDYLSTLPFTLVAHDCTFAHASPEAPDTWNRLASPMQARGQFEHFQTALCFIGHTHIPAVMSNKFGSFRVRKGNRYLVNVGSIGQPRDGDPRLAYGLFDTESYTYELVRLSYNYERVAQQIIDAGLPTRLADRLRKGE